MDATPRILDPEYRADTIAPKQLQQVKLFGGWELDRLISIQKIFSTFFLRLNTPQMQKIWVRFAIPDAQTRVRLVAAGGQRGRRSCRHFDPAHTAALWPSVAKHLALAVLLARFLTAILLPALLLVARSVGLVLLILTLIWILHLTFSVS